MIMASDNPALPLVINESVSNFARVTNMIAEVDREMSALSSTAEGLVYKSMRNGCLHQQLILTGSIAAARLHCFSRATSEAPIIFCERPSRLADALDEEFEVHWGNN
jgi:hypothetical protein